MSFTGPSGMSSKNFRGSSMATTDVSSLGAFQKTCPGGQRQASFTVVPRPLEEPPIPRASPSIKLLSCSRASTCDFSESLGVSAGCCASTAAAVPGCLHSLKTASLNRFEDLSEKRGTKSWPQTTDVTWSLRALESSGEVTEGVPNAIHRSLLPRSSPESVELVSQSADSRAATPAPREWPVRTSLKSLYFRSSPATIDVSCEDKVSAAVSIPEWA
mmetsp:Transcript_41169/g.88475  ORF Transcript_41169/g.88475 Transcript_41169/m.88475 type:complete len:216 (-) Transcript_41169:693-1340(-)